MFDDAFRGFGVPALAGFDRAAIWPRVELGETDKDILFTAELPGLDENDVEILVDDGVLTLRRKAPRSRTGSAVIPSAAMGASSGVSPSPKASSGTGRRRRSATVCSG
ncbi:hypothetical protein FHS96_002850 [Sphingomonas zeicaulis]